MSSTGGGIVVARNSTKPVTGNGKTITVVNNSAEDVTLSDDAVNNLTSVLPNNSTVTIPG